MATLLELAVSIVESHTSSTLMTIDQVVKEIQKVYGALRSIEVGENAAVTPVEEIKPAINPSDSIKKNEVICLVCGKGGMKTLGRHLLKAHNMKHGEYKKRFGIPSKQVLAAENFSESRKRMARERGMADVLAKARKVRMANILAKKEISRGSSAETAAPLEMAKG
ncbi:MAG: MucR family transcriptional regulator [Geobacteraceae bacterium]|nr:MucR family transcriptional regulator [Geobacteraceae bacterium]